MGGDHVLHALKASLAKNHQGVFCEDVTGCEHQVVLGDQRDNFLYFGQHLAGSRHAHERPIGLRRGLHLALRVESRHPDHLSRCSPDLRRHELHRRRVDPAIWPVQNNTAIHEEVRNLQAKVVHQPRGRLVMVLDHERAQTASLRDSHFRKVGLFVAWGGVRAWRVHMKVHVDGSLEESDAVGLLS